MEVGICLPYSEPGITRQTLIDWCRALEDGQRALVAAMDVPSYELPRMAGGIDLGGLYELAGLLREQGMA